MKFKATYAPSKLELTAASTLSIQMGKDMANQPHWVDFTGAITLATGPTPLVQLKFVMTNFWPNSFGIPNVNLDNLILSASASPVPPWIVGLTIGAAVCIGPAAKCKLNKKAENDTSIEAQTGIVTASAYLGININEGTAFFYASIGKTTLADIVLALAPTATLPKFLSKVGLTGYDIAGCNAGDASACKAVVSVCTMPGGTTLELLKPPLDIPFGFLLSGSIFLFNVSMSLKLEVTLTKMSLDMESSPFKIGETVIARSEAEQHLGPKLHASLTLPRSFNFNFQGYIHLEICGEKIGRGTVHVDITEKRQKMKATGFSLFPSTKAPKGVISGNISVTTVIAPPSSKLFMSLDTTYVSRLISDEIRPLSEQIVKLKAKAAAFLKKITDALKKAERYLDKASKKLDEGMKACESKRQKSLAKVEVCNKIDGQDTKARKTCSNLNAAHKAQLLQCKKDWGCHSLERGREVGENLNSPKPKP